jgi:hypothetical protein
LWKRARSSTSPSTGKTPQTSAKSYAGTDAQQHPHRNSLEPPCHRSITCIPAEGIEKAVENLYAIFDERTLKVIPSYVRKLVHSVIEIKGNFFPEYLDDPCWCAGL